MIAAASEVWRPIRAAPKAVSDLIGPDLFGAERAEAATLNMTAVAVLSLVGSLGLLLIAIGDGLGRQGEAGAATAFWTGYVVLLLPFVWRLIGQSTARSERLLLLLILVELLFLVDTIYSPSHFSGFDAMLHWMTAHDILYRHQLFLPNSLLPVSPLYPGVEIVTTSLANLAGLTIFPAAKLLLAVCRGTFIVALFLFFERLSRSSRVAVLACLIYMTSSTFMGFDVVFAYESLAIMLCVVVMLAEATFAGGKSAIFLVMLVAALAVTHHVTALFCAVYLVGLVILESICRRDDGRLRPVLIAGFAIAVPLVWIFMHKYLVVSYLGPPIQAGIDAFYNILNGSPHSHARKLFVSENGAVQPLAYRLLIIGATVLAALGLATGFFRTLALSTSRAVTGWARLRPVLRREWPDGRLVLLAFGAFGYPLSVALRLTGMGWELGNRMNSFVFFSVGLVVAVGIVGFWQSRIDRRPFLGKALLSSAFLTGLLAGVILNSAPSTLINRPYQVGADAGSIEYMGISTAEWTKKWLGEGNRFMTDRVNQTLLGTYGQQDIVAALNTGVESWRVFLPSEITDDSRYWLRRGRVEYLLADLRLTTAAAVLGQYYERDEANGDRRPLPANLMKFDRLDDAGRIFDNGWEMIYDVRRVR